MENEKIFPLLYPFLDYPKVLGLCANAPLVLSQKGNISWKNERILSIVGTRNPTSRGVDFCKQLIEDLAEYNPLIVSGFARGIDIVAHKAAVDNGLETVACLGHGLNQIYPTEHKVHVESVCNQGGYSY